MRVAKKVKTGRKRKQGALNAVEIPLDWLCTSFRTGNSFEDKHFC